MGGIIMIAPKSVETRIQGFLKAWETLRPAKSFSGVSLEQFKTLVLPSAVAREEIVKLENQLLRELNNRESADKASQALMKRMVNAIKADVDEGEDSDLYEAVGYVRLSERRTGRRRGKILPLDKAA